MSFSEDQKIRSIIVIPTIRERYIQAFLEAWHQEFLEHKIFVIEDNPTRTFQIDQPNVTHYSWEDIQEELGEKSWIIPRHTDCIRSFGYYKAYQEQPDMIVTLDDDCYPIQSGFLKEHYMRLTSNAESIAWISTIDGMKPRGVPYHRLQRVNECVLNHGLWRKIPDLDAITQLSNFKGEDIENIQQVIPKGTYFPMCGMNIAFKPKVVPALYFLLMGKDYQFDRFGDIWAGILHKKICDHLGYAITSGSPCVEHKRGSNVLSNLEKETPGLEVNEFFWEKVDCVTLTEGNFRDCYRELAEKLPLDGDYWDELKTAMKEWVSLFPEASE